MLRECAEALCEAKALLLAEKLGGQRIYISSGNRTSPFETEIGPELTTFLKDRYGSTFVHIPSFTMRMIAEERRLFILQNPRSTVNDLARQLKISSRRVEQIRHECREDPRQPSLFD